MRKLLIYIFLLSAAVTANASTHSYSKADTLWTGKPYVTDVRALFTGQTPGVVVTSSLGAPGMTPSVFIQGYHLGNQQPVYIVDGMRVLHLDTLAPDSIESITVLTGAKAMPLYGPAAANGAIVIKTKAAYDFGFHASYGFTGAVHQLAWEPKQITRQEWARYYPHFATDRYMQSEKNIGQTEASFAQTHHVDLQYNHNYKFVAAGTFDFLDNDGPFKGRDDAQRRYSGSARIQYKPLYWLRAELSATMGKSDVSSTNALHRTLLNYPVKADTKYDPYLGGGSRLFKDFTGNALLEFRPLQGLTLRAHAGYSAQRAQDDSFELENATSLSATEAVNDWKHFQYDLETSYYFRFGAHSFQANLLLRGHSLAIEETTVVAQTQVPAIQHNNDGAVPFISIHSQETDPRVVRWWILNPEKPLTWGDGRIGITYKYSNLLKLDLDYYLLHADNLEQDITYHVPSVQAAWDAGNTRFIKRILPDWWTEWNWNVAWSSTDQYSSHSLPIHTPASVKTQSSRLEVGTDMRFQDLTFAASWFYGRDSYGYALPIELSNRGWTFAANYTGRAGDFIYGVGVNAALYKNKCLSSDPDNVYYISPWQYICTGHPLGTKWLNAYAGVDSEGNPLFKTSSDGSSKDFFGNGSFPTATLGFHFDMQWRRWTFNLVAHGNFGQSVMRAVNQEGVVDNGHDLLTRHYMTDSWSEYNWKGQYPKPLPVAHGDMFVVSPEMLQFYNSSASLHNGSFFRIDQIRLQYRLPVRRLHAHVRLFASLENFFLFTKYPGSDPEYNLSWENPGYDLGAYPSTRRIVFGVKFDL